MVSLYSASKIDAMRFLYPLGMGNTDISMSMELGKNPKRYSKFTMTVGKHTRV